MAKCEMCGEDTKDGVLWCSRRCAARAAVRYRTRMELGQVSGRVPYPCRKCALAADCNFMCLGYRLWFTERWKRMREALR